MTRAAHDSRGAGPRRRSGRQPLSLPVAGVLIVLIVTALALLHWYNSRPATSATVTSSTPVPTAAASTAGQSSNPATSPSPAPSADPTTGVRATISAAPRGLRAKAEAVLAVVDATGLAPAGYVGGRRFLNDGRGRTGLLPAKDAQGNLIIYHEYDLNPYVSGVNRGPQRLVVGTDHSAFYTADHYVSWTRLR